mmetsp:Transcript_110955/g.312819  ORF Transcript_110955/g.312819 Transcript_110955/m.312819 type:complete len:272 (+) Transcript_110955:106-921(+)
MIKADSPQLDIILPTVVDTGRFLIEEEFLYSPIEPAHTPLLIAKAAWNGLLPMGAGEGHNVVLLKIHRRRTVLSPGDVHVGRQSRKLAARFQLTIDTAFLEVVKGIQAHTFTDTPGDNWLTDDLASMYLAANELSQQTGVTFHSVELWDKASGRLAAGEIGYTVGEIYSSCTGFALKEAFPGSGTLQLAALGKWLRCCGFTLWDLGMGLKYKFELGGQEEPREAWVAHVRQLRGLSVQLRSPAASQSTKELLASGPKEAQPPDDEPDRITS